MISHRTINNAVTSQDISVNRLGITVHKNIIYGLEIMWIYMTIIKNKN